MGVLTVPRSWKESPMFAAVGLVVLMVVTGVMYEMCVHNRPRRRR
jgi:hypothetical protein